MVGKKAFILAKVFHPAEQSKKIAFTLAEVLITLGIIGVVAALTMPVLMNKYREQVTMNKLKKFYSTMSQAQMRATTEYGEIETWDWVPSGGESNNEIVIAWFNKYFGQYLQKTEVIDKKKLNDDNELVDDGVLVMLSDGSVIKFGGFAGGYMHIYYYTDYKTFKNKTAQVGKDIFIFGFMIKTNGHKYSPWGGCYTENPTQGKAYCTRLLQINNWQVPKEYPFKF